MLPFLTIPLALAGLVGLPTVVAIYWLRNRFRRQPVSSLMLWIDPSESRSGGPRIRRLQTPWVLLLELLAILLLVVAATDPWLPTATTARPVVYVLDDSFSMLAGGTDSPRERAVRAIGDEISRRPPFSTRFILAGDRPQSLGDAVRTASEAKTLLEGWRCRSPNARLGEAIALAGELGGDAVIRVVTDRDPETPPEEDGRVKWQAFGQRRANLAVTAAARVPTESGDRCLVEVTNFSPEQAETTLTVESVDAEGKSAGELQSFPLKLAPGEPRRLTFLVPEGVGTVRTRLPEDDLLLDNIAILLSPPRKTVRCDVRIEAADVKKLVERALDATGSAVRTAEKPDILITDAPEVPDGTPADVWRVHLLAEKDAGAFAGPFILDRGHPLTEGLSLTGTVWGGGQTLDLPGSPAVLAGNVPLLTDTERTDGSHEVRWRFRPDLSTLQHGPNWPVLWWNLAQWHAGQQPGPGRVNLRLGDDALWALAEPRDTLTLTGPSGPPTTVAVRARRAMFQPGDVGIWTLSGPELTGQSYAVNALSPTESDLSAATTGQWGNRVDPITLRLEYQSVGWALIALGLGALVVHLLLIRTRERK